MSASQSTSENRMFHTRGRMKYRTIAAAVFISISAKAKP
jgi:hypothetical protein